MTSELAASTALKDRYLLEGLRYLPKLIELADRNRLASTYGCFDRSFWHYRTADFPSGMYQEAVLPLALAYQIRHRANPYYHESRLKELVLAGITFAQNSAHADGSCDDYFPYERAAGAAAFSLYAATEALLVLEEEHPEFHVFFKRRADYLAREGFRESGTLSNHKALIVLALFNVFLITHDPRYEEKARACLDRLLALQKEEGWFPEYEGCDPGYLTFTIDFLAKYYRKSSDTAVLEPAVRAIEFASYFMHPDTSYGGEYGSRNTFHFMPHGFEIMGDASPWAIPLANAFLESLETRRRSFLEDDRIFIHYVYNYLQAYQDFYEPRETPAHQKRPPFVRVFKEAGLAVASTADDYAVISLAKGGAGKYFRKGKLRLSDAGLAGVTGDGRKFHTQTIRGWEADVNDRRIRLRGHACEYRELLFTPLKFLIFRAFLTIFGRFLPANFMRSLIQKKAITKKEVRLPLGIEKEISLPAADKIRITLTLEDSRLRLRELWMASDATFIYVATSQPYQPASLRPWVDLSGLLGELNEKRSVTYEHPPA